MDTAKDIVSEGVSDYLRAVAADEPASLAELRAATAPHVHAHYQLGTEGGRVLMFLAELMGARRALDVGTFTGYSALALALAMGTEGRVVTVDVETAYQDIAQIHWRNADVATRITAMTGPAVEVLDTLILEQGEAGGFDVVFIDADKENYARYYEQALVLVRPGGLIALDNMLWRGRVADPANTNPRTVALRALNQKIRNDDRVTAVLLPVGDGFSIARKRD